MPKLYDYVLSADCYKVRLLLSLLGVAYESEAIDVYPGRQHKGPAFLALNPKGEVPVLEDGGLVHTDAQAILVHLASSRDSNWLPPADARHWLDFAGNALGAVTAARDVAMLGQPGDLAALQTAGRRALRSLDDHLTDRAQAGAAWVAGDRPSIADIALFAPAALSHDAGIGNEDYPAINLWQRRVRRLPGFIGMPGIPDYF